MAGNGHAAHGCRRPELVQRSYNTKPTFQYEQAFLSHQDAPVTSNLRYITSGETTCLHSLAKGSTGRE